MPYTITKRQLIDMKPCDLKDRLKLFGGAESMSVCEAIDAGFSVSDILRVFGRLGLKAECVRFAIGCAERVSHLNDDPRVAAAINAAKAWVDDPTEENRQAADAAADAAAWAANAADAADAAAWAADAAAWAADAARAAWAANAAANAGDTLDAQHASLIEIFG